MAETDNVANSSPKSNQVFPRVTRFPCIALPLFLTDFSGATGLLIVGLFVRPTYLFLWCFSSVVDEMTH
jgi:hypothetical protein